MMSSSLPWTEEERSEGKVDEGQWDNICCKRGIWDKCIEPELESKLEEVIDKNRRGDCFFLEYSEGMSFSGATELHRTRHENRHLKRNFHIAVGGLAFSVIIGTLNLIESEIFKRIGQTIAEWISMVSQLFA